MAESSRTKSGSTSVCIAGTDRVVLVSSDPTQVGDRATIGPSRVLAGASWTGTRDVAGHKVVVAQAPVYAERTGEVVGMVEIGRAVPSVWSRLGDVVPNLLVYLGVASVLGLGGSLLLSRRVKRQTLGMEPTEIAGLVEHREALVHGVKEGVIAIDEQQRVTVVNDSARQLLGLRVDCVGRPLDELDLDPELVEALTSRQPDPDRLVLVGDRVLALNRRPMRSHGQVIGSVTTLRDRTELSALERELGTSRATSDTLRAQTHEFANQLHTISGLLQLEEYDEVLRFVDGVRLSRSSLYDEVTSRIDDATVAALLIAKASLAAERGVELRLDPELPGRQGLRRRWRATSRPSSATSSTTRSTPRSPPARSSRGSTYASWSGTGRSRSRSATPDPGCAAPRTCSGRATRRRPTGTPTAAGASGSR